MANRTLTCLALAASMGLAASPAQARPTIPIQTVATYASKVAGTPVSIVCSRHLPKDFEGEVFFDSGKPIPVIYLRYGLCSYLTHANQPDYVDSGLSRAMLTVSHEAEHIALASVDETRVECAAVANRWNFVRQFKLKAWVVQFILTDEVRVDTTLAVGYHDVPCSADDV